MDPESFTTGEDKNLQRIARSVVQRALIHETKNHGRGSTELYEAGVRQLEAMKLFLNGSPL